MSLNTWVFKRPMLALSETYDFEVYRPHLPLLGSYKLDGIRALQKNGRMTSRSLIEFKSSYCHTICREVYEHFDGEMLIKPRELPLGETIYHATFSAVMTHGAQEAIDWWVFDYAHMLTPSFTYADRLEHIKELTEDNPHPDIKVLEQRLLQTPEDMAAMEKEALDSGFEGLIVRRPDAPYHCNRSSFKQGYLMKIVRTLSSEAEIVDITEMMHNENEAKIDARGYTKRSSHQGNKTGTGMMGAFLCRDIHGKFGDNVWKCGIGDGMDHAFRDDVLRNWPRDKGKIFTYTFKPYGTKVAPRQPNYKRWRDRIDL